MGLPHLITTRHSRLHRQTRWCVVTGAPCSGKTTIIHALKKRGCRVVPEAARTFINDQLARGLSFMEIRSNALVFERHILMKKIQTERQLPVDETIFLDRAIPDSIAYFLHAGLDPNEPTKASQIFKYWGVFFLDRLPYCRRFRPKGGRLHCRILGSCAEGKLCRARLSPDNSPRSAG